MGLAYGMVIMMRNSSHGFSLIELVIALAIMGILGLVVYPSFTQIQTHAKKTALRATVYTLQMACETYALKNGHYPNTQSTSIDILTEILKNHCFGSVSNTT